MADKKKKTYDCGDKIIISPGFINLKPIYEENLLCRDQLAMLLKPSTSTTYVEPIGRKELAMTWWENCPNQCRAHLPSNKPCVQFCRPLRKYVSILSKKMITTKLISNRSSEGNDSGNESYTSNGKHVENYPKRILMHHPTAVPKQQSNLVHFTPMHPSNNSHDSSAETIHYHLRIGSDGNQPWMQFHVSIDQPCSKFTCVSKLRKSTTPAKRKLDFHTENQYKAATHLLETKRKRSAGGSSYSHLDDGMSMTQCNNMNRIATLRPTLSERWNIRSSPKTSKNDHWFADVSPDVLLYHSDESNNVIETVGKLVVSTQQLVSDNTAKSTSKDSLKRVPKVTPGTTVSSKTAHVDNKEFNDECVREHISSKRKLFPMDTFVLNKHCERLFPDEFIENNEKSSSPSILVNKSLVGNDSRKETNDKQHLSSEHDSDDDDNDEEQYQTFLSLPMPESHVPSSPNQHDCNLRIDDTMTSESVLKALEECPSRKKVFDLSYNDWKNMIAGQQPTKSQMKPTSRFRQTMIELILMRNEFDNELESDVNDGKQLWLPSLFNKETILSPSWKFRKYT